MLAFAFAAAPALHMMGRAPTVGVPLSVTMSAASRREMLQGGAAAVLAACSTPASAADKAEETFNRMAGVLEPFTDVQKGYKLYRPVAWNQVRAAPVRREGFSCAEPPFQRVC